MPKPIALPEWASAQNSSVVEPTLAKKQQGWVGGELPPAEYFNWWQRLVFTWAQ